MARLIALAACIACVFMAGCQEEEPTREVFAERVDEICINANDEISALAAPDAADAADVADAIDAIVAIQRDELEAIDDLVPPRDDRDVVRQWIESIRMALDASETAAVALREGDVAASQASVSEAALAATAADAHARTLGAQRCAVATDATMVDTERGG